jgi:pyridoxine 4-dehydrogenase
MTSETITAESSGTWRLGDLPVRRVGLGAMRLTGSAAFHLGTPSDRERSLAVLRRAVELGVNHIDTAAFYFSSLRSANELINSALAPYADDLVVATKVGPYRDWSGEWGTAARPEDLRAHVEENLRQLGRDHLDVVYLRRMRQDSIAEHFGALAALREAGLVRHLGLSDVEPRHLAEAQAIAPVVSVQNRYGLGFHDPATDALLAQCRAQGIAFVPFFAIAGEAGPQGAGTAHEEEVRAVARAHGASPAQVRIAWTLHQGPATPGTSPRTSRPARSASPTRKWHAWTAPAGPDPRRYEPTRVCGRRPRRDRADPPRPGDGPPGGGLGVRGVLRITSPVNRPSRKVPMTRIALVALVVDDYDEAIRFYTQALGFRLAEDTPRPDGSRWVVVEPGVPGAGAALLLARARGEAQRARIGDQTGGRVGFFLHTDDFARDHARMAAAGVTFLEEPRHEPYGSVAVFQDLYGNRWDLLQPAAP